MSCKYGISKSRSLTSRPGTGSFARTSASSTGIWCERWQKHLAGACQGSCRNVSQSYSIRVTQKARRTTSSGLAARKEGWAKRKSPGLVPAGGILWEWNSVWQYIESRSFLLAETQPGGSEGGTSRAAPALPGQNLRHKNVQSSTLFATISGLWPQLLARIAPPRSSDGLR